MWRKAILLSRLAASAFSLSGGLALLLCLVTPGRAQGEPATSATPTVGERTPIAEAKPPRLRLLALDVNGRAAVLAVGDGPATLLEVGERFAAWPEAVLDTVLPGRAVLEWRPAAGRPAVKLWVFPLAEHETSSRVRLLRDDAPAETLPLRLGAPDPARFGRAPAAVGAPTQTLPAPTPTPSPEPNR